MPQAAPKKDELKQTSPFGKKKSDKDYDCNASLVFEGGRLTRVTFAPRLAVSPYETKTDPKTHEKVPVEQPKPCSSRCRIAEAADPGFLFIPPLDGEGGENERQRMRAGWGDPTPASR